MKYGILTPLVTLGRYIQFLGSVFRSPGRARIFLSRTIVEVWDMALRSSWIVAVVSIFVGAVITVEMAFNLQHPMLPTPLIGYATRDIILLEFSSTMIALVLAGKVGGSIASELGTMRITEQIDALDVMGINSAAFIVLPKLLAGILFFPLLTILSFIVGVVGGGVAGSVSGLISAQDFMEGIQIAFNPFFVRFTLIKMACFGFVIVSISSFWGYYVRGGSLEVGRASTRGVVDSSIALLLLTLVLTLLFML